MIKSVMLKNFKKSRKLKHGGSSLSRLMQAMKKYLQPLKELTLRRR